MFPIISTILAIVCVLEVVLLGFVIYQLNELLDDFRERLGSDAPEWLKRGLEPEPTVLPKNSILWIGGDGPYVHVHADRTIEIVSSVPCWDGEKTESLVLCDSHADDLARTLRRALKVLRNMETQGMVSSSLS